MCVCLGRGERVGSQLFIQVLHGPVAWLHYADVGPDPRRDHRAVTALRLPRLQQIRCKQPLLH